ncbi:MlaE family ABC transporter permease [Congregibacter sp.]|uniref:MlaE family ABC transporter permease n=1 Tax=Congregibacter sp. TaxID=2744308 RepID=UPI003F6A53CB
MSESARASLSDEQGQLLISGDWSDEQLPALLPLFESLLDSPGTVTVNLTAVNNWDPRLEARLLQLERLASAGNREITYLGASASYIQLMKLATAVAPYDGTAETRSGFLSLKRLRGALADIGDDLLDSLEFLGATSIALFRTLLGRSAMRSREFVESLAQAGPQAIGIITLTSVLVGMILAYLGAAQLQQFGAAVFVADLVAIGMLREMGALMTAVVMAGRTGAAYAAQLSTMQSNEEIDAISTLGINPLEFLVVPRVLALILMMPLLIVYADALGIVGGAVVAGGMGVTPLQYISQLESAITMTHFFVGLFKGFVFAALIATAGCRAGMNAGRNSEAVGRATTEAVVTAVVYLIVADAGINILCQLLGV